MTILKPDYVANAVGYALTRPGAYAELKACYGGLMIALGLIMIYLMRENRSTALIFIALIYVGFGSGRLIGILFNNAHDKTTLTYFTIEIASILISYLLYFRNLKG